MIPLCDKKRIGGFPIVVVSLVVLNTIIFLSTYSNLLYYINLFGFSSSKLFDGQFFSIFTAMDSSVSPSAPLRSRWPIRHTTRGRPSASHERRSRGRPFSPYFRNWGCRPIPTMTSSSRKRFCKGSSTRSSKSPARRLRSI